MWPLSGQGGLLLATLPVAAALGLAAIGQFEALVLAVLLGRSTLEYAATVAGAGSQLTALVAAGFTIVALVWLAAQQGDIGGTLRIAPERSGGAAPAASSPRLPVRRCCSPQRESSASWSRRTPP